MFDYEAEKFIEMLARMFEPRVELHEAIKQKIIKEFKEFMQEAYTEGYHDCRKEM